MDTSENLLVIYEKCLLARFLDERLQQWFYAGVPLAPFLSGVGAEIGSGIVASLLEQKDVLLPHYRGFSEIIGKGADIHGIAGEILRKHTGLARGMGDVCSFQDRDNNIIGSSIVLGTKFSIAIGVGYAEKFKKRSSLLAVFFGDGEASRSTFGSALNIASLWKLPVLFVCRNNGLSINASIERMSSTETIAERAKGYSLPSATVSDLEPEALYETALAALQHVRNGNGPFLLEIMERRFGPHLIKSRTSAFLGTMIKNDEDPLRRFEAFLKKSGVSEQQLSEKQERVQRDIEQTLERTMSDRKLSSEEIFSTYEQ